MNYIPYKVRSQYSILSAYNSIADIVKFAFKNKLAAIALTDKHTISGLPEFITEIEKKNKKSDHKVKPILGCDFCICTSEERQKVGFITLLAQNKNGWYNLIKLFNRSVGGMVTLTDVKEFSKDLIAIVGGPECLLTEENKDKVNSFLKTTFKHYFYSVENYGDSRSHEVNGAIRSIKDAPFIYGNQVFYPTKEDHLYQKVVLCSKYKTTLKDWDKATEPEILFFKDNHFFFDSKPSYDTSLILNDLIESYSIAETPRIPSVSKDPNFNANEHLRQLCRDGWKNRGFAEKLKSQPEMLKIYTDRVKEELSVFTEYNLSNYLLVIHDFMSFTRKAGRSCGLRGSAVGCMLSYLSGVTEIDPILPDPTLPYHPDRSLLFSRFINKARMNFGKISFAECSYNDFLKSKSV